MTHSRYGRSGLFAGAVAALVALPIVVCAEPRAVVELFTSQGCSSCPTADQLLAELSRDPAVLALSMPIDYWDYLGWKDTLADSRHTARQKGYSKLRGDRSVYTPQMVVNGISQAPGTDKGAVELAMVQSRQNASVLSVPVELSVTADAVTVTAAGGEAAAPTTLLAQPAANAAPLPASGPAQVWLCPVSRSVQVNIGRGENQGRTVTYTNVVRGWIKLGEWTGARATYKLPRRDIGAHGADALAVLVQRGSPERPGAVIGAALASLP